MVSGRAIDSPDRFYCKVIIDEVMKVKLLKKIRKRFGWYITPSGKYILVDKIKRNYERIDETVLRKRFNLEDDEKFKKEIEIEIDEWCWRHLKATMLRPFNVEWSLYNWTRRMSEKSYKKMK